MSASPWPETAVTVDLPALRAMVAQHPIDAQDHDGRTAALLCAKAGRLDSLQLLIDAGCDVNQQDRVRLNPLLWGCISGNAELVRMMLAAGADLTLTTRFGGVGIHPAAEKGHLEATRLLAKTDINVNHTNNLGWTPLLEAIMLNDGGPVQQEIVELLLEAGADPHMTDQYGVTPLAHAERLGYTEIAQILRRFGA